MRHFPPVNLFTRIVLLVSLSLLLMLGGFALLSFQTIQESTARTLQERLVIAQVTADRVDDMLARTLGTLQWLAETTPLNPDDPAQPENRRGLRTIYDHVGDVAYYVALVNRQGIVVMSEPEVPGVLGADLSDGNCIKKVLAGKKPEITKVFYLGDSAPSVAILVGVNQDRGGTDGLVYVALDLSHAQIVDVLKLLDMGETGYAEIVDENGIIMASTRPARLWLMSDHEQSLANLIRAGASTVGTCHDCHTGELIGAPVPREEVMAFAALGNAPWGVALRQSQDEVMAYNRVLEQRIITLGAGGFLLAIVFTWLVTRSLVRPVTNLTAACQRIATRDLSQPIPPQGVGEIRDLALYFDTMRQRLKASSEEIDAWNQELEATVDRRTRELQRAEQERGELLLKLVVAQEEERRRLARELHDETSQSLTALAVGLDTAMIAPATSAEDVRERLRTIQPLARQMLREVQRIILDLRPAILDDLGLVQAIDWYAESRLQPQGIQVGLEVVGEEVRLPSQLEITLFRIAQEAITNIARHARAEHAAVELDFRAHTVVLSIEDDGCGFDQAHILGNGRSPTSFGLLGMRERAVLMGGSLSIESQPGEGTRVVAEFPWGGVGQPGHEESQNGADPGSIGRRPRDPEGGVERIAQPV